MWMGAQDPLKWHKWQRPLNSLNSRRYCAPIPFGGPTGGLFMALYQISIGWLIVGVVPLNTGMFWAPLLEGLWFHYFLESLYPVSHSSQCLGTYAPKFWETLCPNPISISRVFRNSALNFLEGLLHPPRPIPIGGLFGWFAIINFGGICVPLHYYWRTCAPNFSKTLVPTHPNLILKIHWRRGVPCISIGGLMPLNVQKLCAPNHSTSIFELIGVHVPLNYLRPWTPIPIRGHF